MPQLILYRNKNPKTKKDIPLLLDIQSRLLRDLNTRVVIPLIQKKSSGFKAFTKLTPVFRIEREDFILLTPQLAGVPIKILGEPVGDLVKYRGEIIAALDLLITGI